MSTCNKHIIYGMWCSLSNNKETPVKTINGRLSGILLFAALETRPAHIYPPLIATAWLLLPSGSLAIAWAGECWSCFCHCSSLFCLHKEVTHLPYSLRLLPIVNISTLGEMLPFIPGTFYHTEMLANLHSTLGVYSGCSPAIHNLGSQSTSTTHGKLIYWVMTCAQI